MTEASSELLGCAPLAAAAAVGLGVPLYALRSRGRRYATFAAIILALSFPAALVLYARLLGTLPAPAAPALAAGFAYGLAAAGVHLASLVRARLRARWFRYAVSVPGMAFVAMGAIAGPWLLLLAPLRGALALARAGAALDALRWLDLAPLAVVVASLATSLRLPREVVRVRLGGNEPEALARLPVERHRRRPPPLGEPALRIVQIADPHLGPWQPVHRLRRRIERLLDHEPDLVLLTGDFLTMEGQGTPGALARALEPLAAIPGRCFAIFGNHDHEARSEVRGALAANGVHLLIDEEACVATRIGDVQILGADWASESRAQRIQHLLARFPRRPQHVRLLLLHDPLGFRDVPKGEADLTLSGHTHGGQIGLVSLGLDWTVLARSRWPDHGLFGHGPNRLYVHRGTGFYGFPLRIGVPGEASLLELVPRC
ncbi:MAG TPA: metallophosphoesterase [Myxococcota bacterium]|nr:metallophosphoesterase [Myxococcota bacterium]